MNEILHIFLKLNCFEYSIYDTWLFYFYGVVIYRIPSLFPISKSKISAQSQISSKNLIIFLLYVII